MKKATPAEGSPAFLPLLIIAATALAFLPSLGLARWFLDDKDASSFAGVVLLMVILQLIFFFAKESQPSRDWRGWAAALVFFLLGASIFLFLPFELSLGFWYFRMDLLALALFLAGALALLFGADGLWRMRFLPIYSLLAWPLLTLPVIRFEPQLATLTADFVQLVASALGLAISRAPGNLFTSLASEVPIIIAPACVALAAILGFAAFILPFAYHLRGEPGRKLTWLFLGVLLIELLNLLRIAAVVLLWNYSGINQALQFFYSASGTVLFNISMIAMLLVIPKFGLSLPQLRGVSIFREGLKASLAKEMQALRAELPSLVLPVIALALATAAFYVLDSRMVDYSWLAKFSGQDFSAVQANPAELPYPDDWEFLASDTGFSEQFIVSTFIFERPDGTQVRAQVLSSSNFSALSFSAEDKLRSEGFTIAREGREGIGKGIIGKTISYSKEGMHYSTFCWTQPATLSGKNTYAAFLFTVGDDENLSRAASLPPIAREFQKRLGS